MQQFSFTNALTHFNQVPGWQGFLWKFILAYLVLYSVATAILLALAGPAYFQIFQMSLAGEGEVLSDQEAWRLILPVILAYILAIPVFLIAWSMLEASVQRHYIRREGFSLRLGGDEWRLVVVALLYILFGTLLYGVVIGAVFLPFGMFLGNSAVTGNTDPSSFLMLFPMMLVMMCIILFFLVRMSPAPALTIRDRKITFFGAWRASRGKFWPMLGAYVIIYLISSVVAQFIQLVLMFGVFGALMQNTEAIQSGEFSGFFSSPMLWITGVLTLFAHFALYAATHYIGAGVPALAARTDHSWTGEGSPVDSAFS